MYMRKRLAHKVTKYSPDNSSKEDSGYGKHHPEAKVHISIQFESAGLAVIVITVRFYSKTYCSVEICSSAERLPE